MKYVINNEYGGFEFPGELEAYFEKKGLWYDDDEARTDPRLIEWVENHPGTDLAIVVIPEEATDWEMQEYNGWESITAVVNGKIVHLETREDED